MKWLFREKIEVSAIKKSKTELPPENWKQKCKKWDTKIASGFGLFAFLMLMVFVIYNILHKNSPSCESSCKKNLIKFRNSEKEEEDHKCIVESDCHIKCDDINENIKSVADYINTELLNGNCNIKIKLTLTKTIFNNSKLTYAWLSTIKPKVTQLKIENSTWGLNEITQNAFVGPPFENSLTHLRIVDTNVQILRQESFRGLSTVIDFAFCNYQGIGSLRIEKNALGDMNRTLKTLEISMYIISADDIINLTGKEASSLPELTTLVLSYNSIQELKGLSFNKASKLKALHLMGIGLEKIDKYAFRDLSSLKRLYLSGNILETLPEGTFNGLTPYNGGIELWNNRWKCDCSLEWLQTYYLSNEYINKKNPPKCHLEYEDDDKNFEEVEFCPYVLSSSETSVATTTVIPTLKPVTETPSEYITIKCQDQQLLFPSEIKIDYTHNVEVIINNEIHKLEFHELEGEPLEVIMTTTEDLTDYHLLWFNVNYKDEPSCISPVGNMVVFTDLQRNSTYSFNLLYGDETQVSPKCTFCIKTEPIWKLRPWITNQFQVPFIIIVIIIVIILICLTSTITFFCIRRHPKLISGNKNVIIVKPKKNSEEDFPPRNYEKPIYWDPYLIASSQGYLTPKFERYSRVRYRPPLMRSISEWSVTSASNRYKYDDPRHLQAMRMLKPLGQNSKEIIEADIYDYRPPLPPPNPGTQRPSPSQEEELYSSI